MSTTATRTEPKTTVEKPRLILTHGEKGGVGKTTVARIIADYLVSRDTTFRAFDAEGLRVNCCVSIRKRRTQ